jgi:hypothetical protein
MILDQARSFAIRMIVNDDAPAKAPEKRKKTVSLRYRLLYHGAIHCLSDLETRT